MCLFQFPINTQKYHKWVEKCYNDKFNKNTYRIFKVYFSMANLMIVKLKY